MPETNRCRLAHQMHMFDLFPWHIAGYHIERCVNCGLTKDEIRALIGGPLRPVSRACLDGQHDQCPGVNSAGATCTCEHHDGCPCPCHQVIQPGLVPCPRCEQQPRPTTTCHDTHQESPGPPTGTTPPTTTRR